MIRQLQDYVEAYYPQYYSADEILESDILAKYFDGEELHEDDINRVNSLGDIKAIAKYRQGLTEDIAVKTIEAME